MKTVTLWSGHYPVVLTGNKIHVSTNTLTQGATPYHWQNKSQAEQVRKVIIENGGPDCEVVEHEIEL